MACMYPSEISPDTKSDAERTLYDAFRDGLDNDYTVFHSVAWQSPGKKGRPRDGEADFVIAHPQRGILVLEAKGGTIHYDPGTGKWTSTDPSGHIYTIMSPFGQAKDSKYILGEQLGVMLGVPRRRINIGHAVAFPDVVLGQELLGLDKPREIVLDATDLDDLSGWVSGVLAYWRGQESEVDIAPGEKAVPALIELLGKVWELRPALWRQLAREQQEFVRLTEQQYVILDALNRQRRAAICGCAGSGKTMLAAEKATRLAHQGFGVLLTCFNKNLAADLRARLHPCPNLDIVHFHELCHKLAKQAAVLPEKPQSDDDFFQHQLPEALLKATGALDTRYDAIIVDEGQDFQEHWWVPLLALLRDADHSILYIFFDDNQRLYVSQGAFPVRQPPYPLTINCRNTQNIHQLVTRFYDGEVRPAALGALGRPVEVVFYDDPQQLRPTLMAILQRLTVEDNIPPEEIAVLSPLSPKKSQLWSKAVPGSLQLSASWPPSQGKVFCSSIYSFKGLESAVIVLAEMDKWRTDLVPLVYVGCSRACNHLIVVLPEDVSPEVREAFTVTGAER